MSVFFVIPLYVIQALWIGVGVSTILTLSSENVTDNIRPYLHPLASSLLALLALNLIWTNVPKFDWQAEEELEAWGRYVLSLPLDDNAVILADSEKIAPLEYLHRIEGYQPGIPMLVLGTEEEYIAHLFGNLEAGRTVYLARFLPGLEAFHLRSAGPLIEVGATPLTDKTDIDLSPLRSDMGKWTTPDWIQSRFKCPEPTPLKPHYPVLAGR